MSFRVSVTSFAIAAVLVGAAACGKGKASHKAGAGSGSSAVPAAVPAPPAPPEPSGPPDPRSVAIITKSKELRDRACGCMDAACANQVRADHEHWLHEQIDDFTKNGEPKSTKAEQDEAGKYQHELFQCLDKPKIPAPATP